MVDAGARSSSEAASEFIGEQPSSQDNKSTEVDVTRPSARAAAKSSRALSKSPGGKSDAYRSKFIHEQVVKAKKIEIQR